MGCGRRGGRRGSHGALLSESEIWRESVFNGNILRGCTVDNCVFVSIALNETVAYHVDEHDTSNFYIYFILNTRYK
jgi:hypothetical protein